MVVRDGGHLSGRHYLDAQLFSYVAPEGAHHPKRSAHVRVALLGYGLIRSDAMLSATVRACALLLGGVLGPRGDVCVRVESWAARRV